MIDITIEEEHKKQMLFQWNINQAQMASKNKEQKGKKNSKNQVKPKEKVKMSVIPATLLG